MLQCHNLDQILFGMLPSNQDSYLFSKVEVRYIEIYPHPKKKTVSPNIFCLNILISDKICLASIRPIICLLFILLER